MLKNQNIYFDLEKKIFLDEIEIYLNKVLIVF